MPILSTRANSRQFYNKKEKKFRSPWFSPDFLLIPAFPNHPKITPSSHTSHPTKTIPSQSSRVASLRFMRKKPLLTHSPIIGHSLSQMVKE
jgi:hypothetical protein